MNKLLAVLYLVLSLFGIDVASSAEALCRHTLLPGVCAVEPAVRGHVPVALPRNCAQPQAASPSTNRHCPPPRPLAAR